MRKEALKLHVYYLRARNALWVEGDFSELFVEYYLHLMDCQLRHEKALDRALKESLVGVALHLATRPHAESLAWTIQTQAPLVNYFVWGSNAGKKLVGRLFTDDVRKVDGQRLFAQLQRGSQEQRSSTVAIDGKHSPLEWLESFYRDSEQRPARAFDLGGDGYGLVAGQPDCDGDWIDSLDSQDMAAVVDREEKRLLETRFFSFECGCSLSRIMEMLRAWEKNLDEIFGQEEVLTMLCPRCAKKYTIRREWFSRLDEVLESFKKQECKEQ